MKNNDEQTLSSIRTLLRNAGVDYREIQHVQTQTSAESANARGEPLSTGAKALLIKTAAVFRLFVLRADQRLDSAVIKKKFGVRNVRFATPEELFEQTGLSPGSVPPFGHPILPFELYADIDVGPEGRVAFNAGSLTHSIAMSTDDWRTVADPDVFAFARGADAI